MAEPAISVDGLSKRYRLNASGSGPAALVAWLRGSRRGRSGDDDPRTFWALRDVSFQIQPGEVVAVIGRNGAGKSTLLKVLSRITSPTTGRGVIRGRVASLLEVGTGFHPELTGRENVYMNGSILGMRHAEIDRRFDAIVDFSGVEQFLDTPLKRYSSGMQVRLAFAVAAHLEPEIMIVDEVLAVGDAEFQRKCLGRMSEAAQAGRTVLFVSHNIAALQHLCERGIVLEAGRVVTDDTISGAIRAYLVSDAEAGVADVDLGAAPRPAGHPAILQRLRCLGDDGQPAALVAVGAKLTFEITYSLPGDVHDATVGVAIDGLYGQRVATCQSRVQAAALEFPKKARAICTVPQLLLTPGVYQITVGFGAGGQQLDRIERATSLEVEAFDFYKTGRLPSAEQGPLLLPASWKICSLEEGT